MMKSRRGHALLYLVSVVLLAHCGGSTPEAEEPAAPPAKGTPERTFQAESAVTNADEEGDAPSSSGPSAPESATDDGAGAFSPPPPSEPAQPSPDAAPSKQRSEAHRLEIRERAVDLLDELSSFEQSLGASAKELERALGMGQADCGGARGHRDRVCELAERICSLTAQLPDSLHDRCDDGRARCQKARSDYAKQCSD